MVRLWGLQREDVAANIMLGCLWGSPWTEPKQDLPGIWSAGKKSIAPSLTGSCAYWRSLGICDPTICYGDLDLAVGHQLCRASRRSCRRVIPRRGNGTWQK